MPRFPFLWSPYNYPYYNYYNRRSNFNLNQNSQKNNSITNTNNISNTIVNKEISEEKRHVSSSNIFNISPISVGPLFFNPSALSENNSPVFEMFGIKLFLDDIIIICLLIFLYQEEVKDEMLYIVLFLLLFS